jgi:hypothetical protein
MFVHTEIPDCMKGRLFFEGDYSVFIQREADDLIPFVSQGSRGGMGFYF